LKKKALVITLTNFIDDPRPRRNHEIFSELGYSMEIISYKFKSDSSNFNQNFHFIKKKGYCNRILFLLTVLFNNILKFKILDQIALQFEFNSSELSDYLSQRNYDVIILEDLKLLPLVINKKNKSKIIFDAREYYPKQFENSIVFKLIESKFNYRLCYNYVNKTDLMLTVSRKIQEEYSNKFKVDVKLIMSAPKFNDITINDINPKKIKIVHHGMANRNRQLEKMINCFKDFNDNFIFDLYLVGNNKYIEELKLIASDCQRIQIKNPIKHDQIVKTLSSYDIGFFYVEPSTFNLKYCLPNKFFEFIQARLAILTGPTSEMSFLIDKYEIGMYSKKFDTNEIIKLVNNMTLDNLKTYKKNTHFAAQNLCFEIEKEKLINLIK